MSYVVTLEDYTPSPREDGRPWTQARIDESATKAGPYTTLETVTLSPLDGDPANPQTRSFTTQLATLAAGWYVVTFLDADGNEQPTAPVLNGPSYIATRDDVARKLKARTRTPQGALVGTFDDTTTIDGATVDDMIADAAALVATRLGDVPADKAPLARRAVAIRAAMEVELSFTPEQTAGDETAYGRLLGEYEEAIGALLASMEGDTPGASLPGWGSVEVTSATMTAQNELITPAELLP